MNEDLREDQLVQRMAILGKQVQRMMAAYKRGELKKAERLSLDIHGEVGSLRHRLLDEIWANYQASRTDVAKPEKRP